MYVAGSFQKTLQSSKTTAPSRSRTPGYEAPSRTTRVTYDADADRAGHSPNGRAASLYGGGARRSQSSDGYLEGHARVSTEQDRFKTGISPPPYHKNRAPPSYENHRPVPSDAAGGTQQAPASPPGGTNHLFNNEILERFSDSDSELYQKKESKKKSGIKSKLRGLYRGNTAKGKLADVTDKKAASSSSNSNRTTNPASPVNQFGYQATAAASQNNNILSPKRNIPTYNTYSKSTVK